MSLFGLGSKSSNSATWIDPYTQGLQRANYAGAQQLPGQYTPTSASQIQSYFNPYQQDVVDASMADLNHQRQLAIGGNHDSATSAHAYGGSGLAVADALTNEGFARQGGLLSAQLRNQGFNTALQAAQGENQYGYQYPLQRQGLLNSTLAGVTPNTFGKNTQKDPAAAFSNFGNLLNTAGNIAAFFA